MRNAAITIIVLASFLALNGCSGTPDNYSQQSYDSAGEYTLPQDVMSADSADDVYLIAKAAKRKDYASVMELESQGKAFILKS
ncbi:MAG TPA: hypothetical protein VND42_00120, partial [Candidatus Acidoferrales bacterium]|nr:hypothetical protein [Candidatus Acidoferrales bacterium]